MIRNRLAFPALLLATLAPLVAPTAHAQGDALATCDGVWVTRAGLPSSQYLRLKDLVVAKPFHAETEWILGRLAYEAERRNADAVLEAHDFHSYHATTLVAKYAEGRAVRLSPEGRAQLAGEVGTCYPWGELDQYGKRRHRRQYRRELR